MIRQEEKLHGVVIIRLLEEISALFPHARFALYPGLSRSSYSLKGRLLMDCGNLTEFAIGLFIKTSNKRASPWKYSFQKNHQDELLQLKQTHGEAFVVFVNGDDGIACLDFEQFKQLLDHEHEEQEWVSVARKPKQNYRLKGNDGVLERPLPRNSFPGRISEYFSSVTSDV